jgi:hypothetical protein
VKEPGRLLEIERDLERSFVAEETALDREAKGWPAALIMFHLARWRERLRRGLTDFQAGRPYTPPPANIDEFNDQELQTGRGLTLAETSARAAAELGELIDLSSKVGVQPFKWNLTGTTGDALVRNSYFHPRVHISTYWHENGDNDRAHRLIETTVDELREMWPSPLILGAGLYNLACVRAGEGRHGDALDLLEEAAPMRPDLCAAAAGDQDLQPLRGDSRFQAIVTVRSSRPA